MVDDPAVGLMADHPRQIIKGQLRFFQHGVQTFGQGVHRKAEHGPAIHGDGGGTVPVRPSGMEDVAAPRTQRQGKGCIGRTEDGSSGPVSKQNAGGTVGGIHQAGKCFAPDHERILSAHGRQQTPCHRHAIEKSGAGRIDVQRGAILRQAQRRLYLTGHAGSRIRSGQGGADAAPDIRRGKAAALQRLPCGGNGQRCGGLVLGTPVPGADPGAAGDPFIAGVHHPAQVLVGDRPAGQCPAGGDQL